MGLTDYVITTIGQGHNPNVTMANWKHKQLADLFESFIAAVYIDSETFDFCRAIFEVSFYPRLKEFIVSQSWNDPKSCLQQCCLTLREEGQEPSVPRYHVLNKEGPTHKTEYEVSVVFKGREIGRAFGKSIQDGEMQAAKQALQDYYFPQREWQKQYVTSKYNKKEVDNLNEKIKKEEAKKEDLYNNTGVYIKSEEYAERDVDGRPRNFEEKGLNYSGSNYKYMISSSGQVSNYAIDKAKAHKILYQNSYNNSQGYQQQNSNTYPFGSKIPRTTKKFHPNGGYFSYNQTASYLYDKKISNNLYHDTETSANTKSEINEKPNNLPNFGNQNQSSYVDRYGNTRYLGETSSERRTAEQNLKQVDDNLDMNEFDEFIAKAKRES